MQRNLSPVAWASPGVGTLGLDVILSNLGVDPINLDSFLNQYSPVAAETVSLANGAGNIAIPDTTNTRFIVVVLPRNNTTTVIFKWNNGDTGKYCNPQGLFVDTFDPNHFPSTLYYVTGAAISGVTLLLF